MGFFGSFFGRDQADEIRRAQAQAAAQLSAGKGEAIGTSQDYLGRSLGYFQPDLEAGEAGRTAYMNELGLGGAGAQQQVFSDYMAAPPLAPIMANIGSVQFSRGIQTAQLGISQEQLKRAKAQSAIAQAGEARAAGKERREAGLFSEMFQPRTAQPGLLPAPPPTTDPTMQFRPYPGPINAPAASPIAPSVSTIPAAPFAERFSGMPAQPQPGATPPQPQADTISGVPRREMALSMLGYGDAAKLMAEARKNLPENITRDILVRKEAERKAEIETERPAATSRAINSIADLTKTGTKG